MTNPRSSTDLAPPDTVETLILDLLEASKRATN